MKLAIALACLVAALTPVSIGALVLAAEAEVRPAPGRERLLMDAGWRFALGSARDAARDFAHGTGYFSYLAKAGYGDGPADPSFDDRGWRLLDVPHDWAVELPFSPAASASHGFKAIGIRFPDASVGWYRRTFFVPEHDRGRRITVEFDGVFRDSTVWVNGFYLGREPSGYLGFGYDLTDYLRYGAENVIAVRVDATLEEGWFYEGAGIYRHVWLTKTADVHVAKDGTFVRTHPAGDMARVDVGVEIENDGHEDAEVGVENLVLDAEGRIVARHVGETRRIPAGRSIEMGAALELARPRLWSLESPHLYTLATLVRKDGLPVDRYETSFGVRTIRFDPDRGFLLNGERVALLGTNNHQDHAGVGIAIPDALQRYRLSRLQEMGSNAYRASHNPPTPELLDECDRRGVLVIDENRLMGSSPAQVGELVRLIRRDRNHPSVILWSLGNEEWAIEGNATGARIAATMQAEAHRLDPTRSATVAISGGREGGISAVVDVMGYNYIGNGLPDDHRARFPKQPGVGTEETTTQGTRGVYVDDRAKAHLSPQLDGSSKGNCEFGWQYYVSRPYLAGLFYWTGFDYRGEPTPFGWPAVSSQFGIMDTCGFPKDCFHYLRSWWTERPLVHVSPHWTWPGREGREIAVRVDGNADEVALSLNGRGLGRRAMPRNGHLEWKVKYEPGVLLARGFRDGREIARHGVETAGVPAALRLVPDRAALAADGEDVAVVAIEVVDNRGRVVPVADDTVELEVEGTARILGVGNGDPSSHEKDRFADDIALHMLRDWRGRIAPAGTTVPGPIEALAPLTALGRWQAPLPTAGEVYDVAASFSVPALPAGASFRLVVPSLGSRTTVWVNGHEVGRELETDQKGPDLVIDTARLVPGENELRLLVTPILDGRNRIPERTEFGSLQVRVAAGRWTRRAFNGLAQAIVQAGSTPGAVHLEARGAGLASARLTLELRPAKARASVPGVAAALP